jgi:WD40 repeat protein
MSDAYDVFVVHAETLADRAFVKGMLVPSLDGLRVLLSSQLPPGTSVVQAFEEGVVASRVTVAIISPAFLQETWAVFGEELANYHATKGGRLVPLLLADCTLPLRLEFRVRLDCRDHAGAHEEIRRLRALLGQPDSTEREIPCPYPGMRPFRAENAALFCGRTREIDDVVHRLRAGEREIYVIGPSGSGKSSLIIAGVLPRLGRGVSGVGAFLARTLRPGEHPTQRLAEVLEGDMADPAAAVAALLKDRAPADALLLVIDQLEELFTLSGGDERTRFLAVLRALRKEHRCFLLHTLRADFFGAFMESTLWAELQGQISRIEIAPLRGAALRGAIEQPARNLGVYCEPELVERLLSDAASEPGILPLLQETLVQLWDQRACRLLTLASYQALDGAGRSGLAAAISHRADATLRTLTLAQEAIARRILLRLVSFGEGRADTRRQQRRAALRSAGDSERDFEAVLRCLIDGRLITVDGGVDRKDGLVDLAHEVMITAWSTLADWIRTRRFDEQHRRQLEAAAAAWVQLGRGTGGLLDAVELAEADAWRQTESAREVGESPEVAFLIAKSKATLEEAEQAQQKMHDELVASRGRLRHLLAMSYQEDGRRLVMDGQPLRALPYLVAARAEGEEGRSLRMLFWEATRNLPVVVLVGHDEEIMSAVFSPDGARIATASCDETARIWDAATGNAVTPPLRHQARVNSAVFSPDGTRIVTASEDHTARIWDAATGALTAPPLAHRGRLNSAVFSPDGARVVTASDDDTARIWDVSNGHPLARPLVHLSAVISAVFSLDGARVVTASRDNTARVWNAVTGKAITRSLAHEGAVTGVMFSPEGTQVITVSRDRSVRVWNAATGKQILGWVAHAGPVISAALSHDGARIVTASRDKTARVWNTVSIDSVTAPLLHHEGRVWAAEFSPDGTRIVTASWDKTARVWEAMTGRSVTPSLEHEASVNAATFSPDGTRIVTASSDKRARVWSVAGDGRRPRLLAHENVVYAAEFSPNGTRIVTASADRSARVWNAETGAPVTPSLEHEAGVNHAEFSPDGTRVATASSDKTARIWDAATGKLVAPPLVHEDSVKSVMFSLDGGRVVTASADQTARVWDARTGAPLTVALKHDGDVNHAVFFPDSTCIVTASDDRGWIWEIATGRLRTSRLAHRDVVYSVAISPDGSRIVTGSWDSTARVWDAATGKPITPLLVHDDEVLSVAFSSDGRRVVTTSRDRTARIWDAVTGQPVVPPLVHENEVLSAAFSPDGAHVVTASRDKTAQIWDAATGKPVALPLVHPQNVYGAGAVYSAVFSPDSTQIVTAGEDCTACVWEVPLDSRTLDDWSTITETHSSYRLDNGVLVSRVAHALLVGPTSAELTGQLTGQGPAELRKGQPRRLWTRIRRLMTKQ